MKLAVVLSCLLIHVSLCERVKRQSVVGERCTTPFNHTGDCRNIENCKELLELSKERNGVYSEAASAVIRDSRCESTGVDPPLFCCPRPKPRSSSLRCGEGPPTSIRIRGHRMAELGQWPWMAALGHNDSSSSLMLWFCGGALVTDRHVITAAHCLNNTISIVRLGELNLEDGMEDGASPVDMEVESSLRHPEFKDGHFVNDVAVIKMKGHVNFNAGPFSNVLQQVSVPVASESTCRDAFRDIKELVVDERVICAGNGEKDTCQDDSGGPLMDYKNDLFYLVGVVSSGKSCRYSSPGIYMKVSYYMDWINANIN